MNSREFFTAVITGTALFLLFAIFIIVYIIIYWKKKVMHTQEINQMQLRFNEELLKSSLEMKEQTLNDISQEIHDNVGQMLSLAKVQLNIMEHHPNIDKAALVDLRDTLSKAMTDLRDIAKNLNSEKIQLASLPVSIENHVHQISRTGVLDISISINGTEQKIDERKKLILFRMVQESLQNIIKHAKATTVQIKFNFKSACLDISIADNGIGFDVSGITAHNEGLGLHNMMSRASLIGGKMQILSTSENGTTILISSPYA